MSSNDVVIRVKDLGKRFEIYENPRNRLKQFLLPRFQRVFGLKQKQYFQEFWALKNVSFEIRRGETVGIIGRNGSGKSTLLQMICGTLNPTSGTVETKGRIAALLELGSGFNPEFTGRENVYLNASMLGLKKDEIDSRFDAIAAFADIGQFIEQPAKTYSSGMYVRLAFAVIAHVDADILIVDEALAVGDAVFTQKCMRFIRKFQENGSLIFVSHDTSSVQNLCKTAIWLKNGEIEQAGRAKHVLERYLQYTLQEIYGNESKLKSISSVSDEEKPIDQSDDVMASIDYESVVNVRSNIESANGWKTGEAEIDSVFLENLSDENTGIFKGGELVRMVVRAKANEPMLNPIIGFLVRDRLGQDLFGENTLAFTSSRPVAISAGGVFEGFFEFRLPMLPNGQYAVMASVADGSLINNKQHHWLHDALIINVSSSKVRWGLVGLLFKKVELKAIDNE